MEIDSPRGWGQVPRGIALAALILGVGTLPAWGADNCFEIVKADPSEILIDRCTGDTWMLGQTPPDDSGVFVYVWMPLKKSDRLPIASTAATRQAAQDARDGQALDAAASRLNLRK